MATANFTAYEVRHLLDARKFVSRIVRDTQGSDRPDRAKEIVWDIRRRDMPRKDLRLRLYARLLSSLPGIGTKSTPGVSLQWKGKNIRKLDYALRHDSIRYGVSAGHVDGWHEHIWTDEDEDRHVIPASPPVKGQDMRSVVRWCAQQWKIELDELGEQFTIRS